MTIALQIRPGKTRLAGILACAAALVASLAHADGGATLRLVVGYPPGGSADVAARVIAPRLGTVLGQTVIVENRPGAGGQIAAQHVKGAPADGSVLLLSNTHTMITVPLTVRKPGFSATTDFKPVGTIATFELALAVFPGTQVGSVQDLKRWFAEHPLQRAIGVPAPASAPEFAAARIAKLLRADAVPVPYRGAAPLVQDLIGGQVSVAVSGVSDLILYHRAGKLRIISMSAASPLLPGVPSFSQAGIDGLELTDFLGLYAPAGVPSDRVTRLNAAVNSVLAMPEVQQTLNEQALVPAPGSPDEHSRRLSKAGTALGALVKDSGATAQ
ncbi:Bug family tripartite tricarboxylate transporter substrate binding protein [Cupriavidus oxalaticus]|uniref:Twin-arginine translocation pathway signal n=1 Tax=Cupriavidus oxalaticus TaxID=96344 RepID=A0A4P7LKW5_9BURK|nr:Bug family tripartite tricarboxylate transporter substrate binding protein [Cupriavidus oxalaticus]QBY55439.1 Twin-arginine translocation pathway signal [Cupriavidus oxalaticus]